MINPLDVVHLSLLMDRSSGRPEMRVGLVDGPVLLTHPDLVGQNVKELSLNHPGTCVRTGSAACVHGTFVAGMLCARRGSAGVAICPNCTLLVRPIFVETSPAIGSVPSARPAELAAAIVDCVNADARVINISAAIAQPLIKDERSLHAALDYAASRGVISVAAAGNQGTLGCSSITSHPGVIPVTACDLRGRPLSLSNLGSSIGRRGLMAPGEGVTGLGTNGRRETFAGTSVAAPFVTGAIALLWSEFPNARAIQIRSAITQAGATRRRTVTPPLLDAWDAYQALNNKFDRR